MKLSSFFKWASVAIWAGYMCECTAASNWALRFNGHEQFVKLPYGETIVMDGGSPRFVLAPLDAWTTAETHLTPGANAWQTTNAGASAIWSPQLPRAGQYQIYIWWGPASSSLDTKVQFVVKDGLGVSTNIVNQNLNPGAWTLQGTYTFKADRTEYVMVRKTATNQELAIAGAVMFVNQQAFDFRNSPFTLEAWVNVAAWDKKWQAIITKGNAWGLTRCADTSHLSFRTYDGQTVHDLISAQPLETNRWYHVAATFTGTEKILYIDGSSSASASYSANIASNAFPVLFGGNAENAGGEYFAGQLDNVRLWSIARSQSDLLATTNHFLRGSEDGLLGEWRFDEGAGLVASNNAANPMHGQLGKVAAPPTYANGMLFSEPLPGAQALQFNGVDQFVMVTNLTRFNFTNRLTVESWVYFGFPLERYAFPPDQRLGLVSKGTDAWEVLLNPSGKIVFHTDGLTVLDPAGSTNLVPSPDMVSQSRLDEDTWYHLACVWDSETGLKEIYINGQLDAATTNLQGRLTANSQPLCFGARPSASGVMGFFGGLLDEVRVWDFARSQQQINDNFGRDLNYTPPEPAPRTTPWLGGCWKLDEGSGLVALDLGPNPTPANGLLLGGMRNLNRVEGRPMAEPMSLQYCLSFNGTNQYVTNAGPDTFDVTKLTIEAWVKPAGGGLRCILQRGDSGYFLAIDGNNCLRFHTNTSTRALEYEKDSLGNLVYDAQGRPVLAWNHVGVVVDPVQNTTTFYINGKTAGVFSGSTIPPGRGSIFLGKQGPYATGNRYQGLMDEVRLWNVARSTDEVAMYAFTPLLGFTPPGLIGYWSFNEGIGTSTADHSGLQHNAVLVNMDVSNWRDGTDWGMPAIIGDTQSLTPSPSTAGLWVGQVTLTKVNEAQKATQGQSDTVTDAPAQASFRILLHVGGSGQVRLLKDVIIMKRAETNASSTVLTNPMPALTAGNFTNTSIVLVTHMELLANTNLQGIAQRGGKFVGLRYGTVGYDFEGTELSLLGGVAPGSSCMGRLHLDKNFPTNPYRHKYHPDHRSGFDLNRQFTIRFDGSSGAALQAAPGYGVDRITGTYLETIVGLHKVPLKVQGTVQLDRITTKSALNEL